MRYSERAIFKLKFNGRAVTSQIDQQTNVEVGSVWVCAQGNRLGQISSSNLQGWNYFSVVGPLFISPLLFHLSRALLGAWRFGLFRCVYSSFHNRLDLIRESTFYWVFLFYFLSLALFVSSYVTMKRLVCSSLYRPFPRARREFGTSIAPCWVVRLLLLFNRGECTVISLDDH